MVMKIFRMIKQDIDAVMERDPAARSPLEIVICYSGLHAIWAYRVAHWFWERRMRLIARLISQVARSLTGVEIHPGAKIQRGLFIDHGMGVVIGETAEIGQSVTLYHGVTLGGVSLEKGKRHPTIESNVVIGAGAKVLGAITIGEGSRIGANAVVVKNIPPNSVVVGVPGQTIARSHPQSSRPDLNHNKLPDTIGESLMTVMARLDFLEKKLDSRLPNPYLVLESITVQSPHPPEKGQWYGEDFMI